MGRWAGQGGWATNQAPPLFTTAFGFSAPPQAPPASGSCRMDPLLTRWTSREGGTRARPGHLWPEEGSGVTPSLASRARGAFTLGVSQLKSSRRPGRPHLKSQGCPLSFLSRSTLKRQLGTGSHLVLNSSPLVVSVWTAGFAVLSGLVTVPHHGVTEAS